MENIREQKKEIFEVSVKPQHKYITVNMKIYFFTGFFICL